MHTRVLPCHKTSRPRVLQNILSRRSAGMRFDTTCASHCRCDQSPEVRSPPEADISNRDTTEESEDSCVCVPGSRNDPHDVFEESGCPTIASWRLPRPHHFA